MNIKDIKLVTQNSTGYLYTGGTNLGDYYLNI